MQPWQDPALNGIAMRDGRVAARQTGAAPMAALRARVENALATAARCALLCTVSASRLPKPGPILGLA
jgi:hypothetical protein